jgi:hypothetical protein
MVILTRDLPRELGRCRFTAIPDSPSNTQCICAAIETKGNCFVFGGRVLEWIDELEEAGCPGSGGSQREVDVEVGGGVVKVA